jgi:HAE1 family hydrophobic/amphiphilic exporter-1
MAIAVIGGLITSTLLTLVVVPVAYSLVDSIVARVKGKREGSQAGSADGGGGLGAVLTPSERQRAEVQ